jgi:hypothetical protein
VLAARDRAHDAEDQRNDEDQRPQDQPDDNRVKITLTTYAMLYKIEKFSASW